MAATSMLKACLMLTLSTFANAQYYRGGDGGGYNGYYGYSNPYDNDDDGNNAFGRNGPFAAQGQFLASRRPIVIAHGVLAAAAFVFFFPVGAILIRLGNFRGLWLVHGLFQAFAYLLYIVAFGIGIYITTRVRVIDNAHPVIGIVLFILLFFQPILGLLHHVMFKKHSRRVVWSYGHIWLGRIIITLGIINGGLGLQLAQRIGIFAPSRGAIIAYSVIAAIMWLVYVVATIVGERKRAGTRKAGLPPPYKESPETAPGAPHGVGEYYKNQQSGQQYA